MVETSPQTIAERVKLLRHSKNLTQAEFGKMVNLVPSSVSKIEKGLSKPSGRTISLICQKFHVRRPWLVEGEEPMLMETTEDDALIDLLFHSDATIKNETERLIERIMKDPHPDLIRLTLDFYEFVTMPSVRYVALNLAFCKTSLALFVLGQRDEMIKKAAEIVSQNTEASCNLIASALKDYLKNKYLKSPEELMEKAKVLNDLPEE